MPTPRSLPALAALAVGLFSSSLTAQTTVINTDFNDNPALTLFGVAQLTDSTQFSQNPLGLPKLGGEDEATLPGDKYISVTDNIGSQRGAIVFADPTGGLPISGFTIRADLRVGGGTGSPADGFSFSLARPGDPVIATGEGWASSPSGETNLPEEGTTTGLAIGFDEWYSGGSDTIGMSVRLDNVILQEISLPTANGAVTDATSLQTGPLGPSGEGDDTLLEWAQIEIILDTPDLTINWKGTEVFTGVVNWNPTGGQIILGGRTGGANAHHHMDNLFVEVTGAETALVTSVRSSIDSVEFDIKDIGASILDPASINLTLDGVDVSAGLTVTKTGDTTTIRHAQSPQFTYDTTIAYDLTAMDTAGQNVDEASNFTTVSPLISAGTGIDFIRIDMQDLGASELVPGSATLTVDGVDVSATLSATRTGNVWTLRHDQVPQFAFGSTVSYVFAGMDSLGQNLDLAGSFTVAIPLFPYQQEVAGPEEQAVDGNWGVRYIYGMTTTPSGDLQINNTTEAMQIILDAAADPAVFPGTIMDVSETAMNHGAGAGLITPDLPYHPDVLAGGGCCVDDFLMYGVGYMQITTAGDYTIGVHSDDGFGLRVHGWEFTQVSGAGVIDPATPDTLIFEAPTGDSNTRGCATNVLPGIYRIEFFWWERAGGDHGEVYIAPGCHAEDADSAEWLPIGTQAPGGVFGIPGFSATGVEVQSFGPALVPNVDFTEDANAGLTSLAEAAQVITNLLPSSIINHPSINFHDPDASGPGRIAGDIPFDLDVAAADDDDFLATFSGTLEIPIAGSYEIGFQGDDGGYLRLPGNVFTSISEDATGTAVIDEAGARIACDCLTGNSSTVGVVNLTAGSHPIEGLFFERAGGAYWEVFGTQTGGIPVLIVGGGATTQPLPDRGVALVDTGNPLNIVDIIYDDATDEFTLEWSSRDNKTYSLFYSVDCIDWSSDLDDSIASDGDTTTVFGPFVNPETVAGVRPERIFFRVEEN